MPVKGKPLLFNTLDILSNTKRIKDVYIVVGYKADLVQKTIGNNYEGLRIHYVFNELYSTTNNVYSLAKVKNLITSDCLLLECDLYYTQSLIDNIIDKTDDCDIVVSKYNPQTMNGTVILSDFDNNAKQLVIKKHQSEGFDYSSAWKTVNIYKLKQLFFNNRLIPAIWEYVRSGNLQNYYELVLGSLIYYRDNNIKIVPVDEKSWYEIDDKNDLKIANNA